MITWAFQVIILITFGHLIGLHEFVRNLIKNLSYSASVIWIPPEIQNWCTLQSFCEWTAFVEHESSKHPPLTHSFVLYKWKKRAII